MLGRLFDHRRFNGCVSAPQPVQICHLVRTFGVIGGPPERRIIHGPWRAWQRLEITESALYIRWQGDIASHWTEPPTIPQATDLTPTIYFAIEESLRELDSRLLLAGIAAERGIAPIIGQQWLLTENLRHLPPGIVVFKGNNTIQHDYMRIARRHGHLVASIEEEALGVAKASQILRLYDHDVDRTCQLFLAQGEFHRQVLVERFPNVVERISVVGNPRMDFLRPEFLKLADADRDAVKDKYGPFVLINTNISDINSALGDVLASYDMCVRTRYITAGDPAGERDFAELLEWEHANAQEIARFMRNIRADRPETTIIIRPHPSERVETWQEAFAGVERVHVVRGGAHLPWTLASDILVHTGCTTGMEAFVAGRTAVSLCPGSYQWHDCMVSNRVNQTFACHRDAARFVIRYLERPGAADDRHPEFESVLDHHVAATKGRLAAERVVDALQTCIPSALKTPDFPLKRGPGFKNRRQGSVDQSRKIETSLDDVNARFARIRRTLARFGDQRVIEFGEAMFQVGLVPR